MGRVEGVAASVWRMNEAKACDMKGCEGGRDGLGDGGHSELELERRWIYFGRRRHR